MGLSTDEAIELIGLEIQAHRIGLNFLDKKTRDKINAISNILNNDRALASSNFQKKHSRITGYPSRGVMPSGAVIDLSMSADGKRYEHAIKQASKKFAPLNWFPPAVIRNPQPLYRARHYDFVGKRSWGGTDVFTRGQAPAYNVVPYGYDESQASLAGQWAQAAMQWRHNADIVGKRVPYVQTKYTGSTALVPSGIYSQVHMHSDEYYAMKERLKNQRELRYAHYQNGVYTDDSQYAFGADTGVHDDFAYLREEEREQNERSARRRAIRRSRRAAVMREGLDDYQRFIHENKGKYGREGAEQVFRQRLLKELPPFFKNSKMSTQQLINISKMMKSTSGIPIVGTLVNHPMLAAIGALTAAARAFGSGTVGAIRETMPWVLGETVGGQVSERYKQSVAGVGVGEGEAIKLANRRRAMISGWQRGIGLDAWTRGAMFGVFPTGRMMSMNQEELVDYVSAMAMNIQDEGMRMQALSSYGVSHEDYVASLQRQGLAKKTNQNYIYQIAQRKKDERDKKIAKGAWIWKFLQPDWLIDIQAASSISDPITGDYYKKMLDNSIKTEEASESLKETESSGGGSNTTNTTNNSHAIYISTLNVSADNPQTLVDQLYQMSGGNAYGENRAILASMGSGVIS